MSEFYFLRHGQRVDHALKGQDDITALFPDYKAYDPSLSSKALEQVKSASEDIVKMTEVFTETNTSMRKNIFIHFSPYLRCCQTADLLITNLKVIMQEKFPNYKVRFQLLGDFALSEWVHDKMKNKPPFVDSNDAYNMYTPNLKVLKNRSACSNFRPTNTLGPYNGPGLSYKDYQARCKEYFKKLLATYDKPSYIKNKDIVIVVSHGYVINNFLSYFINHPIFEEIPEAAINFAKRIRDEEANSDDEYDPLNYTWKLTKDSLNLLEKEEVDSTLNLETDIVYYKTNFIKRDELNEDMGKPHLSQKDNPRPSFKIKSSSTHRDSLRAGISKDSLKKEQLKNNNHICPAARNWTPQQDNAFKIKSEFTLKKMNDEAFKKSFDLKNHPSKPISPEVSPNSEPTRSNSIIDLSKLLNNNDIYKPILLKYSTASQVPIDKLNSKVNSQINLAQFQRSEYGSSNESSSIDLPKYLTSIQNRNRSSSNPIYVSTIHGAKDSYFPSIIKKEGSASNIQSNFNNPEYSDSGSGSPEDVSDDLHIIQESQNDEPLQSESDKQLVNRSKSLNYKRTNANGKSLLSKYQKSQQANRGNESNYNIISNSSSDIAPLRVLSTPPRNNTRFFSSPPDERSNKNTIKFIPSLLSYDNRNNSSNLVSTTPTACETTKQPVPKTARSIFYHPADDSNSNSNGNSDSSSSEDESETGISSKKNVNQYIWFGQNRK